MSFYNGDIPGAEDFKSAIAEGLIDAEFANAVHFSQFESSCGKDQHVWDWRYNKIVAKLPKERYIAKVFIKNRWHYMAILDEQTDCLDILLNQNRFHELVTHPTRSQKHYAKYPALRNSDLDHFDTIHEQMMVKGWDNELDEGVMEFRHEELAKLENSFEKRFKRYVIVTFKPDKDFGIAALNANLVDSKFELKKTESWDDYISITQPIELNPDGSNSSTAGAILLPHDKSVDSKPIPKIIPFPKQENE